MTLVLASIQVIQVTHTIKGMQREQSKRTACSAVDFVHIKSDRHRRMALNASTNQKQTRHKPSSIDDHVRMCVCLRRHTEAEQLFRSFCIPVEAKLSVSLVFHSPAG